MMFLRSSLDVLSELRDYVRNLCNYQSPELSLIAGECLGAEPQPACARSPDDDFAICSKFRVPARVPAIQDFMHPDPSDRVLAGGDDEMEL